MMAPTELHAGNPARQESTGTQRPITLGVVIVNYNYARFVADAIESALDQRVPFDRIVVVDDGSTDDSLKVIRGYGAQLTVVSKSNGGQLSASLAGIDVIDTDYVYVLDADDYASPELVETVKAHLTACPVKLQFQLTGVDEQKQPLGSVFPHYPSPYGSSEAQADNVITGFYVCPSTSGNIYHAATLRRLPLESVDPRDFIDGPATLALPYLGEIQSLNCALGYYRVHGSGHSRWDRPDSALLQFEVDWFFRRWAAVCQLLGWREPPFQNEAPLYVLERRMMQQALTAHGPRLAATSRYIHRLHRSRLTLRQKLMLSLWALSTLLPIPQLRRKLLLWRRSPVNRSSLFKRLVNLCK